MGSPADKLTAAEQKAAHAWLLAAEYKRTHKREFPPTWYDWQLEGFNAMEPEVMTLAGNQTGKTWSGTYHDALDITGRYPDDWEGFRFDHNVEALLIGVDSDQLRVLQTNLFGKVHDGKFEGGWIHRDEIDHKLIKWSRTGSGVAQRVPVRGKYGLSMVNLKAYTQSKTGQGTLSFAGAIYDLVHADEQVPDALVGQLKVRLTNGNRGKGGRLRYTMTPELGMTAEVAAFMESPAKHQRLVGPVAWDECSHITPEVRERLLQGIPEHERDMRSKGIPFFGQGLIYPVPEERILVDPFPIPDYWRVLKAVDLGWNNAGTGWLALDMEADTVYLVRSDLLHGENAATHASVINSMWPEVPTVFPPDVNQTEKGSGKTVRQFYRQAGIRRTVDFENPDGSKYVEPGIMNLQERMRDGRFKVFRNQNEPFLREKRMYHRKVNSAGTVKIVKENDHVMDLVRYGTQMIGRRGVQLGGRARAPEVVTPGPTPLRKRWRLNRCGAAGRHGARRGGALMRRVSISAICHRPWTWERSWRICARCCRRRPGSVATFTSCVMLSIALAVVNGTPPFAPQPQRWSNIDEP